MNNAKQQRAWFKRQYYVWQPISWQGYATIAMFLLVTVGNVAVVIANPYSNELLWLYLNVLFVSIASLLIIGSAKGPAAK